MQLAISTNRRFRQILTLLLVFGSLLCMFPPESYSLRWWSGHAQIIVLGYLGLAMIFLIARQERLMFVCLGCCAAMAFYLNESVNARLGAPAPTNSARLTIAHFNVGASGERFEDMISLIRSRQADLVSCQELTFAWDSMLTQGIGDLYPFSVRLPDWSSNGLAVFSKMPFQSLDTLRFQEMPILLGKIWLKGTDTAFCFASSITRPTLSGKDFSNLREQLKQISYEASKMGAPVFAFGEFNIVPWSAEILEFKNATHLLDSRKPMQTTIPNGYFQLFEVPVDHIFYSNQFDCLNFEELSSKKSLHVGIEAVFQLKQIKTTDVEKTAQ
jgi:endonuclease/exonuclease/phosphatase (EEP) superfamily protein YafD